MTKILTKALLDLKAGQHLTETQSEETLAEIFSGHADENDIKDLLVRLADKGETVSEIVGFAKAMRKAMVRVPLSKPCMDVCGTGGSGKDRFNTSTAMAFVLAACGVPVAKHGNYGSSKPNGSFNFLEALQIPIYKEVSDIQAQFNAHHLTFLFARNHHPAMRFVGPVRQALGRRTIFNVLGPLCNPAEVTHHLLGTTHKDLAEKLAEALSILGIQRAWVYVGGDGSDDISLTGTNIIYPVSKTVGTPFTLSASDYGLDPVSVQGGTGEENVALFRRLLETSEITHPVIQQILLNTACALTVFGKADTVEYGLTTAQDMWKNGKVHMVVQAFCL